MVIGSQKRDEDYTPIRKISQRMDLTRQRRGTVTDGIIVDIVTALYCKGHTSHPFSQPVPTKAARSNFAPVESQE
jgi:hypothetical protein